MIESATKSFSQCAVIVDRLEVLVQLLGPQTLDLIKQIRQSEILFPFFAHADTSLIDDSDHLKIRLSKVANAIISINQDNPLSYQVKSLAIKSGSRFVDETAVL